MAAALTPPPLTLGQPRFDFWTARIAQCYFSTSARMFPTSCTVGDHSCINIPVLLCIASPPMPSRCCAVRMIIKTRSTPNEVEAIMRRLIRPGRGTRNLSEFWLTWDGRRPPEFVGWVSGSEFELRRLFAAWRYSFFPVLRGSIVACAEGSEIRITMRPWLPELLGPLAILGVAAHISWRSRSILPPLIATAIIAPMMIGGWLTGARRARKSLSAPSSTGAMMVGYTARFSGTAARSNGKVNSCLQSSRLTIFFGSLRRPHRLHALGDFAAFSGTELPALPHLPLPDFPAILFASCSATAATSCCRSRVNRAISASNPAIAITPPSLYSASYAFPLDLGLGTMRVSKYPVVNIRCSLVPSA